MLSGGGSVKCGLKYSPLLLSVTHFSGKSLIAPTLAFIINSDKEIKYLKYHLRHFFL